MSSNRQKMRCTIEMNKLPKMSVRTNDEYEVRTHVNSISRQQMWITSRTTLNFWLVFIIFFFFFCVSFVEMCWVGFHISLFFYNKSNSDRCYNLFWLFVSFTARTNHCLLSDSNLWKLKIESKF